MPGPTSLPCPICGRMNAITRTTCSTCEYEFIAPDHREPEESLVKRLVGRLTGRPS